MDWQALPNVYVNYKFTYVKFYSDQCISIIYYFSIIIHIIFITNHAYVAFPKKI